METIEGEQDASLRELFVVLAHLEQELRIGEAAVTISRQYDLRARIVNEADGGSVDSSATTGSLGVIAIGGVESGHYFGTYPSGCLTHDTGAIKATISSSTFNYVASASWGSTDTAATMSTKLASAINSAAGSVVTATPDANNASYVDLYSTATGTGSEYSVVVAVTDTATTIYPEYLANPSFSADAQAMVGGTNTESTYGTIYSYDAGYAPNGNLLTSSDFIMGTWHFSYDAADRLVSAMPVSNIPTQYQNKYGCWSYDAFGNRTLEAYSTVPCTGINPTPQIKAVYNPVNNQIQSVAGTTSATFAYDASGNTLYDGINYYWYDAEGQLCAVQRAIGGTAYQYVYDAEGTRIAKGALASAPSAYTATCAPPLGVGFQLTSQYLVDLSGEQVTELTGLTGSQIWLHSNVWAGGRLTATYDYNNNGNGGIHFELMDPLGTKRAQANALGQVDETCTSLPFGNDIGNPLGVNCTEVANSLGTNDDATEHHFTGKERDTESGNDYFGARYYASSMGRWLSPDTDMTLKRILANPQRWNRYAYVINNPLMRIDPDRMADFRIFDNYSNKDLPAGGRPNWNALAAAARKNGHTVEIYNVAQGNSTQANMNTALHSQGSYVLSIGHSVLDKDTFGAIGIQLGNHTFMGNGTGPDGAAMMPFSGVTAAAVTFLGCNSLGLGDQFPTTTTFTGISGPNPFSNSLTDEQAGAAWFASASSLPASQPVNLGTATAAANGVVTNSKNTVQVPGEDKPVNVDKGSSVKERQP